ncbi:MAG TPA: MAPEG family protein [Chitinivibrionales bacterium]|nr:MAPEG family protein [Chitinivibrionales bacterium]
MTIELTLLVLSVILGIIHLIMASHFASFQFGYKWTAGNRDKIMPPLNGIAGRMERIASNYLETFPFFASVIIIAHLAGRHNSLIILGAYFYLCGRIAYAIIYAIGIPLLRSLIWNVATIGIFLIIVGIFVK